MSSELQRKCWEAEENDKISREFLAVSDKRLEEANAEIDRLRAALIEIKTKGRTTGYGRGALAQIAARVLRDK